MSRTLDEIQDVFRQVFDDDGIALGDSTTADDVDGWDSMMHINLIIAIERRFGVKFAPAELAAMKGDRRNIGDLVELIDRKLSRGGTPPA